MTMVFCPIRHLKVFVYRNLNKGCWSIRSSGNRGIADVVIAHADKVMLLKCEYKVSQAGRKRVLEQRRKNVHAGVQGDLLWYLYGDESKYSGLFSSYSPPVACGSREYTTEVTYDPYKYSTFIIAETKSKIETSLVAFFDNDGKLYV